MLTMIKLSRKWWLKLLIIVNYLRNRAFVADRNIISYKIWMNSSSSLSHIRSIDKFEYALNRKLVIDWIHKKSRDFLIMLIEFQKNHIYKMIHFDDKLKTYFKINWINDSWRKNLDEQKKSKWFKLKLLFFNIHKHQLFDNHEHQTSQMIVSERIQRRKRFASNVNDLLNSLTKISRIEEIMNENTSISQQQSSASIVQKEHLKNFINTDDKKNENSLTRSESFELRSRFIQTLTRTKTACEI